MDDADRRRESLDEIAAEYLQRRREHKEAFLVKHMARTPPFPPTGETGRFAGLVGHATAVGVSIRPYYRTPGGVYFCFHTDRDSGEEEIVRLDVEGILRQQSALFYTPASFLGDEPVALFGALPAWNGMP